MNRIDFRLQRNFGDILGSTFTFIRENFVSLLKPLLTFSVLPVIIGGSFMSGPYLDLLRYTPKPDEVNPFPIEVFQNFGISFLVGYPLMILGFIAFYLVVNSYIKLYVEGGEINSENILQEIKSKFFTYLGAGILVGLIVVVGFSFCFFPGVYFMVLFAITFIVISVENVGVGSSLSRSYLLMKNEWWSTFGLYLVVQLIQSMIVGVFGLPMYIYVFLDALHKPMGNEAIDPSLGDGMPIVFIILNTFYYLGLLFSSILITVAVSFKYFSLVEKKEGFGELQKISGIGENR